MKDYNSNFEKLDTSVLTQLSSLSKKNNESQPKELVLQFKNRDLTIQRIGNDVYYFRQYDTIDNTITFDVNIDILNSEIRTTEKLDEIFSLNESYYLNGNLRSKTTGSWLGFAINKGFKYDSEGNLIETIDNDKGYDFDYEDVSNFCNKKNIDILSKDGPSRNTIFKTTLEKGRKVWIINYHKTKNNKVDTYQLDGKTGEIIQKWLDKEVYGIKHY